MALRRGVRGVKGVRGLEGLPDDGSVALARLHVALLHHGRVSHLAIYTRWTGRYRNALQPGTARAGTRQRHVQADVNGRQTCMRNHTDVHAQPVVEMFGRWGRHVQQETLVCDKRRLRI